RRQAHARRRGRRHGGTGAVRALPAAALRRADLVRAAVLPVRLHVLLTAARAAGAADRRDLTEAARTHHGAAAVVVLGVGVRRGARHHARRPAVAVRPRPRRQASSSTSALVGALPERDVGVGGGTRVGGGVLVGGVDEVVLEV